MTASLFGSPGLFSVFWLILIILQFGWSLISKFSKHFTKLLRSLPSAPVTNGITVTFTFYNFLVLRQGLSMYPSFRFLWFSLCGPYGRQSPLFGRFSFWSGLLTRVRYNLHLLFCCFSSIIIIIMIIIFLASGISQKFKWLQVSSGLQDSS